MLVYWFSFYFFNKRQKHPKFIKLSKCRKIILTLRAKKYHLWKSVKIFEIRWQKLLICFYFLQDGIKTGVAGRRSSFGRTGKRLVTRQKRMSCLCKPGNFKSWSPLFRKGRWYVVIRCHTVYHASWKVRWYFH